MVCYSQTNFFLFPLAFNSSLVISPTSLLQFGMTVATFEQPPRTAEPLMDGASMLACLLCHMRCFTIETSYFVNYSMEKIWPCQLLVCVLPWKLLHFMLSKAVHFRLRVSGCGHGKLHSSASSKWAKTVGGYGKMLLDYRNLFFLCLFVFNI